jgi:excisionase family DNA binding protein
MTNARPDEDPEMPVTVNGGLSDFAELRLIDVDQLCELWGVKKSWVYDQVEAGKLPAVRLGKQLRFRESDLASYLGNAVAR